MYRKRLTDRHADLCLAMGTQVGAKFISNFKASKLQLMGLPSTRLNQSAWLHSLYGCPVTDVTLDPKR